MIAKPSSENQWKICDGIQQTGVYDALIVSRRDDSLLEDPRQASKLKIIQFESPSKNQLSRRFLDLSNFCATHICLRDVQMSKRLDLGPLASLKCLELTKIRGLEKLNVPDAITVFQVLDCTELRKVSTSSRKLSHLIHVTLEARKLNWSVIETAAEATHLKTFHAWVCTQGNNGQEDANVFYMKLTNELCSKPHIELVRLVFQEDQRLRNDELVQSSQPVATVSGRNLERIRGEETRNKGCGSRLTVVSLTDWKLNSFPDFLGLGQSLKHLDLSNNLFPSVPRNFTHQQLLFLNLAGNTLLQLNSFDWTMPHLQHLDLSETSFSEQTLKTIGDLKQLVHLCLRNATITQSCEEGQHRSRDDHEICYPTSPLDYLCPHLKGLKQLIVTGLKCQSCKREPKCSFHCRYGKLPFAIARLLALETVQVSVGKDGSEFKPPWGLHLLDGATVETYMKGKAEHKIVSADASVLQSQAIPICASLCVVSQKQERLGLRRL